MYNFMKELKNGGVLVDKKIFKDMQIRVFNHINFDKNIIMSVQASFQHYCTPKRTINIEEYTTMELGFIRQDKYVKFENITTNYALANKQQNYELGEIYANVPCELIENVYMQLLREYRQKQFYQHEGRKI